MSLFSWFSVIIRKTRGGAGTSSSPSTELRSVSTLAALRADTVLPPPGPAKDVFQRGLGVPANQRGAVFHVGGTGAVGGHPLLKDNSVAFVLCFPSVTWSPVHYIKLWLLHVRKNIFKFQV